MNRQQKGTKMMDQFASFMKWQYILIAALYSLVVWLTCLAVKDGEEAEKGSVK